jgi:hypothetical protein
MHTSSTHALHPPREKSKSKDGGEEDPAAEEVEDDVVSRDGTAVGGCGSDPGR